MCPVVPYQPDEDKREREQLMTKTACILVIDANRESMGHYQRLLQTEGYGVEIATFLEATQEEIQRWCPDLVVFDV